MLPTQRIVWSTYGGWKAVLRSPYLYLALFSTLITLPFWTKGAWWEVVISITPNLLGFTLGAFAILMGFGDDSFRATFYKPKKIDNQNEKEGPSIAMDISASFVQFAVFQLIALVFALIVKAWAFYSPLADPIRHLLPILNGIAGFFGFWIFLYAMCLLVAAMHSVFAVAQMFQLQVQKRLSDEARRAKDKSLIPVETISEDNKSNN